MSGRPPADNERPAGPEHRADGAPSAPRLHGAPSVPSASLTRRDLLKGLGLGAVGLSTIGLLEACAPAPSVTPPVATATPSKSPSASASPVTRRITIGFVTPLTGPAARFAMGDAFVVDRVRQSEPYAKGVTVGGTTYDVAIVVKDSRSDPDGASQAAADLILQDRADLIVTSSGSETTNPVAALCEVQGVPCLSTAVPWEDWFFSRQIDPGKPVPFRYSAMFFFGARELAGCFIPMWNRVRTNKRAAHMFPDGPDRGMVQTGLAPLVEKAGYEALGGPYTAGSTDFAALIADFKDAKCEVYAGAPLGPDFDAFWRQAFQRGYKPKIATVSRALQFPADVETLGSLAGNVATAGWWSPTMPYKSSLSGETSAALAQAYEVASGARWLQTLGSTYALFEVVHAALTKVTDPFDRSAVAAALGTVSYAGICGPLDLAKGPYPGIGIVRPVGMQWHKGTTHPWELVVVDNSLNKAVPVGGSVRPTYA
ncbi:MAG: ABC transporter substrate-binding protein [Chloroflexota bacterium]|nr:ABC transporter substrate-binding protein [Chloroflexota bacterium]